MYFIPASSPNSAYNSPIVLTAPYQSIMIHDGKIKFRLDVNDILFLKSEHVYVRIYLKNNQSVLYRESLNALYQQLDLLKFIQVHRSYVVNFNAIEAYDHGHVKIGSHRIPISRSRRKDVLDALVDFN